jgi:hypothetical protein
MKNRDKTDVTFAKFPWRATLLALTALLPSACAEFGPPGNPMVGTWNTPDRQQIAFRDDGVLITLPGQQPTPMTAQTCDGDFRFSYRSATRQMLLGLTTHQPDLYRKLTTMLVRPEYPVAEVNCGEGYSAYVLLDEQHVVVIHRDRDVGGLEQLTKI